MHTPFCGHALGTPQDYVRAAAEKGLHLLTFTCHIPMSSPAFGGPTVRMRQDQLADYVAVIEDAAQFGRGLGVEVLCGIEAEVFPDLEVMTEMDRTLSQYPFDFILGSLHHQVPAYQRWLFERKLAGDAAIIEQYFEHLIEAAATGRYHSLAHPDVIRLYGTIRSFEPARCEPLLRRFLRVVAAANLCIEVNTSGYIKESKQLHPDPLILDWAAQEGVLLTIGSDAHRPNNVGQYFDTVVPLLQAKGFTALHYHRAGKRIAVPLTAW